MHTPPFQIHCIALCKNEADVIADCLNAASTWADHIYVFDGASTDNTWEQVQAVAADNPRIIPWKQDGAVFRESLRAEVFAAFRDRGRPGDWWCQLNVDEYYPENPRDFLSQVPTPYHVVWGINVEYKLTPVEIQELDFKAPFATRRSHMRHYRADHSEIRFFRDRKGLRWDLDQGWPYHIGLVFPERIYFQHYPYRSPEQVQERLDLRRESRARGFPGWAHASQATWQEKLVEADQCAVDTGDHRFEVQWQALPRHQPSLPRRLVQWAMHGLHIWP